ncbi:MAG: hypothetical protein JNG89_20670 [Planctomycetaceae bacterium]|nr:hypothetical protein [Planctomycetaceae bacterium]
MSAPRNESSTATSIAGCLGLGLITSKLLYAWTGSASLSLLSGLALAALTAAVVLYDAWRHPVE